MLINLMEVKGLIKHFASSGFLCDFINVLDKIPGCAEIFRKSKIDIQNTHVNP